MNDSGMGCFSFIAMILVVVIIASIGLTWAVQDSSQIGRVAQIDPPGLIGPDTLIQAYSNGSRYSPQSWKLNHVYPGLKIGDQVMVWISWRGFGSLDKVESNNQIICNGNC